MSADERELVERCLSGDATGVRAFVERFQGAVFSLCFRMLGHRQDAEDVSQEVFVRAIRSLEQWDSSRPLMPWLYTIASNRCRTALSDRKRRPNLHESFADLPESKADVSNDLGEELQIAIESLREEYRFAFVMFYQQEMSCAEIGEVLGRPDGTIKTWLHRARHELAEYLKRRGIGGEVTHELYRI